MKSAVKEEMLAIFNTTAATERRLGDVFVEQVKVKRTTVGTQSSMQNLCFSTAKVKVFWGLNCISLQNSDYMHML